MEFKEFDWKVSAVVEFMVPEAQLLIKLAKTHYDDVCQAAGLSRDEGGLVNGFLARLIMFHAVAEPAIRAVWTFDRFDLSLKVLEMLDMFRHRNAPGDAEDQVLGARLALRLQGVCTKINREYERVHREQDLKDKEKSS